MKRLRTNAAHEDARRILSNPDVSTEAIEHLRRNVTEGRMIGRDFDRCFVGLLAEGSGQRFPSPARLVVAWCDEELARRASEQADGSLAEEGELASV